MTSIIDWREGTAAGRFGGLGTGDSPIIWVSGRAEWGLAGHCQEHVEQAGGVAVVVHRAGILLVRDKTA